MTNSTSINHLPPEILAHIFTDSLAGTPLRPATASKLLAFAVVCWHWREVSLGAAAIWANIEVVYPNSDSLSASSSPSQSIERWDEQTAGFVSLYMGRSSYAPLSIGLDCLYLLADQIPLTLNAFLGQSPTSRWQYVRIRASESIVLQFIHTISTGASFPTLEHLDIERGRVKDRNVQPLNVCLYALPKLHTLRMAGSRSDLFLCLSSAVSQHDHHHHNHHQAPYAPFHPFPLRRLVIQVNTSMVLQNYLALLRLCPDIEELTLCGRFSDGITRTRLEQLFNEARAHFHANVNADANRGITATAIGTEMRRNTPPVPFFLPLPHLHTLYIHGPAWASDVILACISAPGLTSIEVSGRNDRGLFVGGFIVQLMTRTTSPLTNTVTLTGSRSESDHDGSLRRHPALRRLIVPHRRLAPDTAKRLLAAVPTIRTLGLAWYYGKDGDGSGREGFCNLEGLVLKGGLDLKSRSESKSESSEEDADEEEEEEGVPEPILLPNLEELIVYSQDKLRYDHRVAGHAARVLIDVIDSRCQCPQAPQTPPADNLEVESTPRATTVTRLKSVKIVLVDRDEHHDEQTTTRSTNEFDWLLTNTDIQRCVKEGLRIDVCARRASGVFDV